MMQAKEEIKDESGTSIKHKNFNIIATLKHFNVTFFKVNILFM
jgi:hypothetical protein